MGKEADVAGQQRFCGWEATRSNQAQVVLCQRTVLLVAAGRRRLVALGQRRGNVDMQVWLELGLGFFA
jgi:hypothetical protein